MSLKPVLKNQDVHYQANFNSRTRINVSGKKYELFDRLIENFPKALLGCKKEVCEFYDPKRDEYFFDRSREAFEGIIMFYQTLGEFHVPMFLPVEIYYEELKFFKLDQYLSSESTCEHELLNLAVDEQYNAIKTKFNATTDKLEKTQMKKQIGNLKRKFNSVNYYYDIEDDLEEKNLPTNKYLRFLWLLFEKPNSTWLGSIIAFICLVTILVSIVSMCIETMWKTNDTTDLRVKESTNDTTTLSTFTNSHEEFTFFPDVRLKAFYIIEFICNTIFTLEILIRAISSPNKLKFFSQFTNLIDLISIIPFWFTLIINNVNFFYSKLFQVVISNSKTKLKTNQYGLSFLKILRLTRILRVFKLSRHIRTMKIMGEILRECAFEIVLLLTFLAINIVIFSSLIFYIELYALEDKSPFISIPHSFWWAVISFTTIGYGLIFYQVF